MEGSSNRRWTETRERVLDLGASVWVKLPLERNGAHDPDWDAYYRFVGEDGRATVAEVRILPRTRSKAAERELHSTLKREGERRRVPASPLAAFAKLYVDVVRRGSRSAIADIAGANPGWTHSYVRDQVYLAREKGFLTPSDTASSAAI